MKSRAMWACVATVVGCTTAVGARQTAKTWNDPTGDAVTRRTDDGQFGLLIPGAGMPDLSSVRLAGWSVNTPGGDPFDGIEVATLGAQLFRLDVTFAGLLNPPGPIQFPDDPARYGQSPLYGFLDFDVDGDIDTGGEQPGGRYNYLEEIARFGSLPIGPLAERAARRRADVDFDFYTPPYYERSGADFTLTFCGCTDVTIVQEGGNGNGIFDADETWLVRGRFFQRSGAYQCASYCFGGTSQGLYDPEVTVRFQHRSDTNRTTVSLVFPLTMHGAALLAGHGDQPANFTFGNGDDASVFEALNDVITAVNESQAFGACQIIASHWSGRQAQNYLNVSQWSATAIFGSAYLIHPFGASYIWSDIGFSQVFGDMNGDGVADAVDQQAIRDFIASNDGGSIDCDGMVDGRLTLCNFAQNYDLYDVNGDGVIDQADIDLIVPACSADWDHVNGLTSADFFAFLNDFFAGHADFDRNGVTTSEDFLQFLQAFFAGCH